MDQALETQNLSYLGNPCIKFISSEFAGGKNHPARYVEGKKKNNLPRGFGSGTFCAINPKRIAGTCPGDSGK